MKFELYIDNHKYKKGIEDYVLSIKKIFSKNKIKINVVNKISNDVEVLFVIENFVSIPKELLKFLKHSKSKNVKFCLIHSEFINKSLFLNIFSSKGNLFRKCICVKKLSYMYNLKKHDFKKISFYFLTLIYLILGFSLGYKFLDIKKRIYFAIRDYNLSKYIHLFNYHLALSDDVYNCLIENTSLKNIFYLQDYFDTSLIKRFRKKILNNNLLYFTGYKTPFRKNIIKKQIRNKFNNFFVNNNLDFRNYNFSKKNTIDFNLLFTDESSIYKLIRIYENEFNIDINKFEIYISQRNNWPYLSPMRIIRALRNQSIPINVGVYNKSNYENLCINVITLDHFMDNYNQIINNYLKNIDIKFIKFNCSSDDYFYFFMENINN